MRRGLACVAISALLLAAGACSSSGSSSGGSGDGPIKFGMISDVGTSVNFTDAVAAARAAVRGINARGGINGRKVELVFCNEGLDPNKAAACVRQMISEKVVVTTGNQIVTYEQNAAKLLAKAGIPNVGPVSYGPYGSDANTFMLSPGQEFVNAAQADAAVRYGGKNVGLIRLDVPFTAPFEAFYAKALAKLGATKGKTALIPATGEPDLAAAAASLQNSSPDVVNTNGNEPADGQILTTMINLGYTGKQVVSADLYQYSTLESLGKAANQVVFVSPFPPVSAAAKYPGLQQFVTDMKAEAAAGDKDAADSHYAEYNRTYELDAYFSVIAAAKVATSAKATTPAALTKALRSATNVDLGGVIPPWTPNKSISSAVPRASTGVFYVSAWKDGRVVQLTSEPVDVTPIVDQAMK